MKLRRNVSQNLISPEVKSHSNTFMGLGLRSIVNVSSFDGHPNANSRFPFDFPPKCCEAGLLYTCSSFSFHISCLSLILLKKRNEGINAESRSTLQRFYSNNIAHTAAFPFCNTENTERGHCPGMHPGWAWPVIFFFIFSFPSAIITSCSIRSDDTPQPFEGSVDFDNNSLKGEKNWQLLL